MSMPDYDIESNICTDQWECFVSLDTQLPSIFASQCFPRPSMDSSNCYTWATSMTSLTSITPLMLIFNNFRRPAIDRSVAIPLVATDALRVLKLVTVVGVARPADVIFTKSNLAIFIVSSPIIDNIKMVIVTLCGCHDHEPWRQNHGGLQSLVVAFLDPSALFFALTCSQL